MASVDARGAIRSFAVEGENMASIIGARRAWSIGVGVLCAIVGGLWLSCAPALGVTHLFVTSFGSFSEVQGVAVDQSTGDVYVLDTGAGGGSLFKFDASGNPVKFTGLAGEPSVITGIGAGGNAENELAVDNSAGPAKGDVYVAVSTGNNNRIEVIASDGKRLGAISEPSAPWGETCGVATDPSGAVYVGLFGKVDKFVPKANPVTNADYVSTIGGATEACNLAVDSAGNVFAVTWSHGPVTQYEASQFGSLSATGSVVDMVGSTLAVDPASDHVYVDEKGRVAEFGAHGEPFEAPLSVFGESGEGAISGSYGIGVNGVSGNIYVSDGKGHVSVFGPSVALPSATTEAAMGLSEAGATLHGTVDPEGSATTYQFEYGTTTSYGSVSPASPGSVGSDSTGHALEVAVNGLAPATTYHYRISATNAVGTVHGADMTLRTTGHPVIDSESSSEVGGTETKIETQIDPDGFDTAYRVEYGLTSGYGSTTSASDIGSGTADQGVSVVLTGLQPGSLYHYRVVASNTRGSVSGPDQTFTKLPVAFIAEESFSHTGSSSVTLTASVNDLERPSSYYYEYGPTAAYGSSTSAVGLGALNASVGAPAQVQGLQPGTLYHYRIVITNGLGSIMGPDATFTTLEQGALGLPDGRGYEMVTPAESEGVQMYAPRGAGIEVGGEATMQAVSTLVPVRAAADGNSVVYGGEPNAEGNGSQGFGKGNEYLATRAPSGGWVQHNIQPFGFQTPQYVGFSSDLSEGVLVSEEPLTPSVTGSYQELYARDGRDGSLHPLFTVTPPDRGSEEFGAADTSGLVKERYFGEFYGGDSADGKRLFFEANDALTPNAVDGGREENNVYESYEGVLRLVNVLPNGTSEPNAFVGAPPANETEPENAWHAVSSDGSRVFWTDLNTGALYVRENGTSTALVAEHAKFLTAAADGSRVLYAKGGDLYEDDLADDVTSDLVPGGEVLGMAGASEDASYVYFVAQGALAPSATAGKSNLYLYHAGMTTFIATLGTEGEETLGLFYPTGVEGDWRPGLGQRTAEASPDGHGLVFMSKSSLTGYDNRNSEGERVSEVYVYDALAGSLACVSCNPSGERPNVARSSVSGYLPVSGHGGTYQLRLIFDGGGRVLFQSAEGLVPQDTNHTNDVYEWERDGIGSCQSDNGCVYLISGGSSQSGSFLIDASEGGSDVFFVTRSQLVGQDKNDLYDVYDARVGAIAAPSSPPVCTGTGCQGAPATPPVFSTPPSATYAGLGNFPAPVKGAVKKKTTTVKHAHKKTKRKKKKAKNGGHGAKRSACRRARGSATGIAVICAERNGQGRSGR